VELTGTTSACNALDLDGESPGALKADFRDRGGNRCGCQSDRPCQVLSSGLVPPQLPEP
jgi:hypothetical protein